MKNLRKHSNEYEQARKRYETRKTQEARQAAKHPQLEKEARSTVLKVDTEKGR